MSTKPKHAVLRDAMSWEGIATTRLQQSGDGALTLLRLPAAAGEGVRIDGPWDVGASGLAIADERLVCLADTAGNQVLCRDRVCDAVARLTGLGFVRPRGLLLAGESLYVADSGNARVQVFDRATLELRSVWQGPFSEPAGLAADRAGRVYVLDNGLRTVLRLSGAGFVDEAYLAVMAKHTALAAPAFLALDERDILYVSDRASGRVLRFDPDGRFLGPLQGLDAGQPRALAAGSGRLYVADAARGEIRAFRLDTGEDLGALPGFQGPVAAMAVDATGAVRVKTDPGLAQVLLAADQACAGSGAVVAGPLDAGVEQVWERLAVEAAAPPESAVRLEVHLAPGAGGLPAAGDWREARSLDTLLPPPDAAGNQAPSGRYLWLRLTLASHDRRTAPVLSQVHAVTTAPSYMEHLPAVYTRADAPSGFLRRWLALFRSGLGDLETLLDDMARRFDPVTAPVDHLPWLAGWVAFDLPDRQSPGGSEARMRALILAAHDIYTRRGTKRGLREAIARYTGFRPEILEAYRERRIWQLDIESRLGFDTGLPPARPDGAVVPDAGAALIVGDFVVAESRPQQAEDLGEPLFDDAAHLFSVVLPAGRCVGEAERARLRAVIDAEKPAHTDYHLCFVEARMRVGFQARIGVDTLIAGPLEPLALDASRLGLDAFLGGAAGETGMRLGYRSNVGQTARVG